ncbi:MAG: hypothetical protein LT071_06825 [Nocardioides sp.]|nr:hypothetical protein [Nocardioides sp.]
MNTLSRAVLVVSLAPLLWWGTGCSDASKALDDSSSCPGETCTDDTRERLEAIERIDGVGEVERVARVYGADRGSGRFADVRTDLDAHPQQVDLGLAVMRELEDWPDHADGVAKVTVTGPSRELVLRLDGDWVCEEVDEVIRPCAPENSWLISGEKVGQG